MGRPPSPATIDVFEPLDGWTGVLWPEYFNLYDVAICRALSERLDTVVSAVGLAGNDGWSHHLLRAGTVLDRFASYPLALAQHLGEEAPVASSVGENVAPGWDGILSALLVKNPRDRTPTLADLRRQLEELDIGGSRVGLRPRRASAPCGWRRSRSRPA